MDYRDYHEPVLAGQSVSLLVTLPGLYIDGTLGGGGKVTSSPVRVTVRSGETLMVGFNDAMDDIYLEGPARVVYRGTITL